MKKALLITTQILKVMSIVFVIIMVHEFGHYTTAKYYNVPVKEFHIGTSWPSIFQFEYDNTKFSISPILVMGSVSVDAEKVKEMNSSARTHFYLSGIFFNLLLAVIIGSFALNKKRLLETKELLKKEKFIETLPFLNKLLDRMEFWPYRLAILFPIVIILFVLSIAGLSYLFYKLVIVVHKKLFTFKKTIQTEETTKKEKKDKEIISMISGPIGMYETLKKIPWLTATAILSLSIGALNIMPLKGFDGYWLIDSWLANSHFIIYFLFKALGVILMVTLIMAVLSSERMRINPDEKSKDKNPA